MPPSSHRVVRGARPPITIPPFPLMGVLFLLILMLAMPLRAQSPPTGAPDAGTNDTPDADGATPDATPDKATDADNALEALRARPPVIPVSPGTAPAQVSDCCFEHSREEVTRVIKANVSSLRRCYENSLKSARPGLSGRIELEWRIEPDGSVSMVRIKESTLGEPDLERCLSSAIGRFHFKAAERGCTVAYPFVFKPAE